jgi:hypothetical protein
MQIRFGIPEFENTNRLPALHRLKKRRAAPSLPLMPFLARWQRRDQLALHWPIDAGSVCFTPLASLQQGASQKAQSAERAASFSGLARFGPGRAFRQAEWWPLAL